MEKCKPSLKKSLKRLLGLILLLLTACVMTIPFFAILILCGIDRANKVFEMAIEYTSFDLLNA